MFRSAATKIAHNSTIPALGGNSDLRPLQDLILAEKQVLTSLQRLSGDFGKAAEALRVWGSGEGDDLGDILGASATLLTLWSSAVAEYATHHHSMRDYMKTIRTREERLDDLKRRRKAVSSKAEAAEKKLSKMGPEHKNLTIHTDALNALRAEIRTIDSDIMTEEAAIGDYKRSTTRAWMGLKFGGLLECAEKGTIAGEYGKLLLAEIPQDHTQPGMARSLYYGRAQTEQLLTEAHRCMNEVVMSTVPSNPTNTQNAVQQTQQGYPQHTPQSSFQGEPQPQPTFEAMGARPSNDWSPHNSIDMASAGGAPPNFLPAPEGLGTGQFLDQPGSPTAPPGSPTHQRHPSGADAPYNPEAAPPDRGPPRSVDDFGVNAGSRPIDPPVPGTGGRFATFPVKNRPSGLTGYTLTDAPRHESGSFSSSVAQTLSSSQSPPGTIPQPTFSGFNRPELYQAANAPSYAAPQHLPPGAAAPQAGLGMSLQHEESNVPSDDEGGLAYMTNGDEPHEHATSRHVRFGGVDNVNEELERRSRLSNDVPQDRQQQIPPAQHQRQPHPEQEQPPPPEGQPPQYEVLPPSVEPAQPSLEQPLRSMQPNEGSGTDSPTADTRFQSQRRIPPPSFDPEEDERALNAAAAREVSREMDALTFNPPRRPFADSQPPRDSFDRGRASSLSQSDYRGATQIDNSPLAPPSAPFSRQTPSPHPGGDSPTLPYPAYNAPSTTYTQPDTPAQYAQGPAQYQQEPLPPAPDNTNELLRTRPSALGPATPSKNFQDDHPRLPPLSTNIISSPYQSPYQTPPEYPRGLGMTNSPATRSATSLNSQGPPGTRTISAAAFKRSAQRIGSGDQRPSLADGQSPSPLSLKKRLPSSPYPQQREASPIRRGRSGSPAGPPAPAPSQALPPVPRASEEDYGYLGAYVRTGSPSHEAGALDQPNVASETGGGRVTGGYGGGKFATNLEGSLR
ncbi:putative eisosome component PIL1 [Lyophyllum shimeji]|uniref:Eisosome component PIL1 n=1 Tax=Lyophyllum shimeji TaxID=47721 RepID=A0A9P3UPP6_LYOSH|nr:putative eisosome component PIL1 [Lyophyllum shimeji]